VVSLLGNKLKIMTVITVRGKIDKEGVLSIKHPSFLPQKEVEVTVVFEESLPNRYDFSDLAGKLSWQGNGLEWQKKLRNEWE
jgi:hypothetical protein